MFNVKKCALVSKKALREGKINYGYRDDVLGKDSGWRFFLNSREEVQPEEIAVCQIGKLLKYFPHLSDIVRTGKNSGVCYKDGSWHDCSNGVDFLVGYEFKEETNNWEDLLPEQVRDRVLL
jgi:hypothetical protein